MDENYYFVEGYNKRFFDVSEANKYFGIIGKTNVSEQDMMRYSEPKKTIEIMAICEKN